MNDVGIVSRNNLIECVRVDSVVLRDSVFIREKSDTVFYTKYRTVYKELLRVDTIVRCDTLYRDREVIVEREKPQKQEQKEDTEHKLPFILRLSQAAIAG